MIFFDLHIFYMEFKFVLNKILKYFLSFFATFFKIVNYLIKDFSYSILIQSSFASLYNTGFALSHQKFSLA